MKIIDLDEHRKRTYFHCLEEWSDDMKDSGPYKENWYEAMKKNGLRVKLAVDDNENVVGMIQYLPVERTHVIGTGLYFIYCIWVHGHKQGVGNNQHRGIGKLLLQTAENDVRESGGSGIAAWGLALPVWMKASWFKKMGYRKIDKDGLACLMWKPFSESATPPKWAKIKAVPVLIPGKVSITAFVNGWCPAQNIAFVRAKRVAEEFPGSVIFNEINMLDEENRRRWGNVEGLFIDDKQLRSGPPPSYEKIKKIVEKRVKKSGIGFHIRKIKELIKY